MHWRLTSKCVFLAALRHLWQAIGVKHRIFQRSSLLLGMVAMLVALFAVPLTTTAAFANSGQAAAATKSEMPCHKPAKPCPDCPQKSCPDMGNCLVKCSQPLAAPASHAQPQIAILKSRYGPAPSQVAAGSLIPPLLRPPSV